MDARRQRWSTQGRLVRLGLAVVIGVAIGVGVDVARSGGPAGWLARRGIAPPYDAIGRQVPVDAAGRTVYLDCRGTGSPTVVFEGGAGTGAAGWGFTFTETAAITRACAWDRPGIGNSTARGTHTAADTARDLRAALAAAGESPPFVVVGHSLGGVYSRIFAHAHHVEVTGLVLVDPYLPDIAPVDVAPVPSAYRAEWHASIEDTNRLVATAEELDWPATERELRAASLGDLPLELVFVDQRLRYPATLGEDTIARLVGAWESLVLGLSDEARLTIAHGSGHLIQLQRPELVVESIRRLVSRTRQERGTARAATGARSATRSGRSSSGRARDRRPRRDPTSVPRCTVRGR